MVFGKKNSTECPNFAHPTQEWTTLNSELGLMMMVRVNVSSSEGIGAETVISVPPSLTVGGRV